MLQSDRDSNSKLGHYQIRNCGEPAISVHSYTVPLVQWFTRLLPVMRDPGSIHRGYLCETGILLLGMSCYIGDPDVIDHCGLVWGRPELSCWQCDNPTWSHTALLYRFHARCRSFFRLHNQNSWLLGGSPVESLQSPHTQFHRSSGPLICFLPWWTHIQSPGEYLCETGILLLALSCYKIIE